MMFFFIPSDLEEQLGLPFDEEKEEIGSSDVVQMVLADTEVMRKLALFTGPDKNV